MQINESLGNWLAIDYSFHLTKNDMEALFIRMLNIQNETEDLSYASNQSLPDCSMI